MFLFVAIASSLHNYYQIYKIQESLVSLPLIEYHKYDINYANISLIYAWIILNENSNKTATNYTDLSSDTLGAFLEVKLYPLSML